MAGITLAIGIGANTAIYSVVDAVLLNPLPYPESDRIVSANHTAPGLNLPVVPHSEAMYLNYLDGFHTLESFAVFDEDNVNLVTDGDPQRIDAARVTQEFFDVMGVHPMLGRAFTEGRTGPAPSRWRSWATGSGSRASGATRAWWVGWWRWTACSAAWWA